MGDATLFDLYRHDVDMPRRDHYTHFFPGGKRVLSTGEFLTSVACLADGLAELGIRRGDRVMLLSDNRPEWHMADLATLDIGAVDVPIYATLTPPQIAYQANDSGAVAAIVESSAQMAKFLEIRRACPTLKHLIQIEGAPAPGCTMLDEVISAGTGGRSGDRFWQRAARAKAGDLATIVYTSGTTGEPKGVMLSHGNLVHNVIAAAPRVPVDHRDLALEFLPLCHVLERMLGYVYMWRATSKAYCSVHHVADLMATIAPTLFAGVPRFFEKVRDRILEKAGGAGVRAALVEWAIGVGKQAAYRGLAGRPLDTGLAASAPGRRPARCSRRSATPSAAASATRSRAAPRCRCTSTSSSTPSASRFSRGTASPRRRRSSRSTAPIAACCGSAPSASRSRTSTLRFAADGELLVKGPSITSGYWNKPQQTAEVLDAEGYFATGDIADLDDDGFLLITDRKKDLIVTGGGKNVAPQPIEAELKRCPLVDQAVLIGDGRPAIVALLSPNLEELQRWARGRGIGAPDPAALVRHADVVAAFAAAVETVNAGLARYEQIKTFRVLPAPLSLEGGHLTPTLKVKRRVVEREYAALVEEMYRGQ